MASTFFQRFFQRQFVLHFWMMACVAVVTMASVSYAETSANDKTQNQSRSFGAVRLVAHQVEALPTPATIVAPANVTPTHVTSTIEIPAIGSSQFGQRNFGPLTPGVDCADPGHEGGHEASELLAVANGPHYSYGPHYGTQYYSSYQAFHYYRPYSYYFYQPSSTYPYSYGYRPYNYGYNFNYGRNVNYGIGLYNYSSPYTSYFPLYGGYGYSPNSGYGVRPLLVVPPTAYGGCYYW